MIRRTPLPATSGRRVRPFTLVVLMTLALAVPTRSGEAAEEWPILHLYSRSAKGEICVINGAGTERRCLTDNHRFDYDAVWAPDGNRIAFVQQTNDPRNPDIYVMDATGAGKTRLTRSRRDDDTPQWSPDGTRIVWNRNRGDSPTGRLMVMNADGTGKHRLAGDERDDLGARWSPTGGEIVFNSRNDCYGLACTISQLDVHVVDVDGSNERNLTQSGEDEFSPVWSPDGSRIAFARMVGDDDVEIFVMNADGSGIVQLTDTPEANVIPAWSPDGSQIAFTQVTDFDNFETRLGVVDVGTREVRILTTEEVGGVGPTWSPDGANIAFSGHRSLRRTASYEIHTVRPDGSELRRLTRTGGDEFQLQWSY